MKEAIELVMNNQVDQYLEGRGGQEYASEDWRNGYYHCGQKTDLGSLELVLLRFANRDRIEEVRGRTKIMGLFNHRLSLERVLFSGFYHYHENQLPISCLKQNN